MTTQPPLEAGPAPAAAEPVTTARLTGCWLLLAIVVIAWWPGDVSWLIDEPRIIANAWHANHHHQLAEGGLYGNFGIRYGPFPTQIYQLLLLITHDPRTLVVLRVLLSAGVTAAALWWMARSLALPAWFAAALLITPHAAACHRMLWDASFAMPVGAVALAALADFLRTGRIWSLRAAVIAGALLPLIHPQALPLSLALAGWLFWRCRGALWRDRRALAALAALALVFQGRYIMQAGGQMIARFTANPSGGYPGGGSHALAAVAPLLGGNLLSGAGYLDSLAKSDAPRWLDGAAKWSARLIHPILWLGIGICATRAFAVLRLWRNGRAPTATDAWPVRDSLATVAVLGLLLQAALFGAMRIPPAPQYFFGTFALHAFAGWIGVDCLYRWRAGRLAGYAFAMSAAFLTINAAWTIHRRGFERPGWPTLSNSLAVVHELNRYAAPAVFTDIELLKRSPQIIRTLALLVPPPADPQPHRTGRLLLTHPLHDGRRAGEVTVVEIPPGTGSPPSSAPLDVTPLPRGWIPDPGTW